VSSHGCGEIVESSDAVLYAGPTFTDYTTAGHATVFDPKKVIVAQPNNVVICDQSYPGVPMRAFLSELARQVNRNTTSLDAFNRVREEIMPPADGGGTPITTRQMFDRIQKMLTGDSAVIAETGDSWFNGVKLSLPEGARFEIQMQYGSIGWSVGATLGYALGSPRRLIALIGDGSFQMTAQEVSTMIRYRLRPIIFLINNGGYTIEVEIHDGPYNVITNWDYAGLVDVFNAGDGNGWSTRVTTQNQLDQAIAHALGHDGLSLIEVVIDRTIAARTCSSGAVTSPPTTAGRPGPFRTYRFLRTGAGFWPSTRQVPASPKPRMRASDNPAAPTTGPMRKLNSISMMLVSTYQAVAAPANTPNTAVARPTPRNSMTKAPISRDRVAPSVLSTTASWMR